MKISIITVSYNSEKTIERTIKSVLSQQDVNIEYIIIDGNSTDNTLNIIKRYSKDNDCIKWKSESDNGIYDAMNKGILLSTGDIVGILNSDDYYVNNSVLSKIESEFKKNTELDSCYGNLLYIKSKNRNIKAIRYWKGNKFKTFKFGWMPPHPAFFVRKTVYDRIGLFRLDCGTAADYEFMLRCLEKNRISTKWINSIITYMEAGGASGRTLDAYKKSTKNDIYAWKINGIEPILGFSLIKKIRKLPQFIYAKFIKV